MGLQGVLIMEIVKGYKATDKNMQCRGFQFELGRWYKHDGEVAMCESGFHFCEYPSGPWSFYSSEGTRVFHVEARGVLMGEGPGADLKHVAMEIRLVSEIEFTGNRNTGDGNTGYRNTGDGNTGYGNTGDRNTGNGNTGYGNTGYRNTGDGNTGNGNASDRCAGHFCIKPQPFILFDDEADESKFDLSLAYDLGELLSKDDHFDVTPFLSIQNATEEKIKSLHQAHIQRRSGK